MAATRMCCYWSYLVHVHVHACMHGGPSIGVSRQARGATGAADGSGLVCIMYLCCFWSLCCTLCHVCPVWCALHTAVASVAEMVCRSYMVPTLSASTDMCKTTKPLRSWPWHCTPGSHSRGLTFHVNRDCCPVQSLPFGLRQRCTLTQLGCTSSAALQCCS